MRKPFQLASLFAAAFLLLATQGQSFAQRGDWELLGERKVGFLVDRDTIKVGRGDGRFEAIQLGVEGNEIEILDLKVVYANGQPDDLRVRERIRAGGRTRAIDLKGRDRAIREIQVIYRSRPSFRGQATLRVFGREADRKGAGNRPGKRDWEKLGSQKVGFLADRDIIKVGRREGRFNKIQLRVKDNEIEIRDLEVVYANGNPDSIRVRNKIRAGGETRPLDLKGDARAIREIRMSYASRPSFRGQATIEVWGLQD